MFVQKARMSVWPFRVDLLIENQVGQVYHQEEHFQAYNIKLNPFWKMFYMIPLVLQVDMKAIAQEGEGPTPCQPIAVVQNQNPSALVGPTTLY